MAGLSAATAATSSPAKRSVVSNSRLSSYHSTSAALVEETTACTPGRRSAREVSMRRMRAWGWGERSTAA